MNLYSEFLRSIGYMRAESKSSLCDQFKDSI